MSSNSWQDPDTCIGQENDEYQRLLYVLISPPAEIQIP